MPRVDRGIYTRNNSPILWIKWYRDGKPHRESTGSTKITVARAKLAQRQADVSRGALVTPKFDRLKFDDAAADVVNDYKINGKRSLAELERRLRKHLLPFFGGRRLVSIGASDIRAYVAKRQAYRRVIEEQRRGDAIIRQAEERPYSNAEINRELAIVKRIFSLAAQGGKIFQRPHVPMLKERAPRSGFFEPQQFEALLRALPMELRPVIEFAYITGWRIPSEVLKLQWRQVDFSAGEVRLDSGTTKNGDGRVFPMTARLRTVLTEQRERTQAFERERGRICPWVFHRHAERIKSFRHAFATACEAAGCPGRIPHDFRRTAVRGLSLAGVPEAVAMKLTGHKTRSVFDRYNIVSNADLRSAAQKLDQREGGHKMGTTTAL